MINLDLHGVLSRSIPHEIHAERGKAYDLNGLKGYFRDLGVRDILSSFLPGVPGYVGSKAEYDGEQHFGGKFVQHRDERGSCLNFDLITSHLREGHLSQEERAWLETVPSLQSTLMFFNEDKLEKLSGEEQDKEIIKVGREFARKLDTVVRGYVNLESPLCPASPKAYTDSSWEDWRERVKPSNFYTEALIQRSSGMGGLEPRLLGERMEMEKEGLGLMLFDRRIKEEDFTSTLNELKGLFIALGRLQLFPHLTSYRANTPEDSFGENGLFNVLRERAEGEYDFDAALRYLESKPHQIDEEKRMAKEIRSLRDHIGSLDKSQVDKLGPEEREKYIMRFGIKCAQILDRISEGYLSRSTNSICPASPKPSEHASWELWKSFIQQESHYIRRLNSRYDRSGVIGVPVSLTGETHVIMPEKKSKE